MLRDKFSSTSAQYKRSGFTRTRTNSGGFSFDEDDADEQQQGASKPKSIFARLSTNKTGYKSDQSVFRSRSASGAEQYQFSDVAASAEEEDVGYGKGNRRISGDVIWLTNKATGKR